MENIKNLIASEILEIKKSKFIAYLIEVNNKNEFDDVFLEIKKQHKKSRHICYGYMIQEEQQISEKYSDDGEPKGTAKIPIQLALKKLEQPNVALFVVRYFGGTKLGSSCLYRTYLNVCLKTINKI